MKNSEKNLSFRGNIKDILNSLHLVKLEIKMLRSVEDK